MRVAVNCCWSPTKTAGLVGETNSAVGTGELTVRRDEALTDPRAAVIDVLPMDVLLAKPAVSIPATAGREDVQVTDCVKSCVEPSLYVPVAANCCGNPKAMEGETGVT